MDVGKNRDRAQTLGTIVGHGYASTKPDCAPNTPIPPVGGGVFGHDRDLMHWVIEKRKDMVMGWVRSGVGFWMLGCWLAGGGWLMGVTGSGGGGFSRLGKGSERDAAGLGGCVGWSYRAGGCSGRDRRNGGLGKENREMAEEMPFPRRKRAVFSLGKTWLKLDLCPIRHRQESGLKMPDEWRRYNDGHG